VLQSRAIFGASRNKGTPCANFFFTSLSAHSHPQTMPPSSVKSIQTQSPVPRNLSMSFTASEVLTETRTAHPLNTKRQQRRNATARIPHPLVRFLSKLVYYPIPPSTIQFLPRNCFTISSSVSRTTRTTVFSSVLCFDTFQVASVQILLHVNLIVYGRSPCKFSAGGSHCNPVKLNP
jgi:hypothetical protein